MHGRPGRCSATALTCAVVATVLGVALGTAAPAAARPRDPVPVGPGEYFRGYLDGKGPGPAGHTVLNVICASGATSGHPAPNQTVEVKPAQPPLPTDLGNTGSAGTHITAMIEPAPNVVLGRFTSYNVPESIPTSLSVPCSGTARATFRPWPNSTGRMQAILIFEYQIVGG